MSKVIVEYDAEIKKMQAKLSRIEKGMGRVETSAKKSTKQIKKGFDSAGKQADFFKTQLASVGAAFVGAFAVQALVQGVVSEIKKAIEVVSKFEKSFANVITLLSSADAENFREPLKRGAVDLMIDFGLSIEDVNKALFDAVSAGIPAAEVIEFLNKNAILATGGVTDLKTAVDGTTSIMNAYSLATSETERVTSAFFTAQKFGKTTVAELAANIGKVAPIAKQAEISFETLLGATAQLTLGGLRTEEATTALQAAISSIIKPSKEAEKVLREFNIPVGASELRSRGLSDALTGLARAARENPDALAEMIPNIRALRAVGGLTEKKMKEMDEIIVQISKDVGEGSSLLRAYGVQMETLAIKTAKLESAQAGLIVEYDNSNLLVSGLIKSHKDLQIGYVKTRIETLRFASSMEETHPVLSGFLDIMVNLGGTFAVAADTIVEGINAVNEAIDATKDEGAVGATLEKLLKIQAELNRVDEEAIMRKLKDETVTKILNGAIANTEKAIKAQITALKGLKAEVEINSDEYNRLKITIAGFEARLPSTTKKVKEQKTEFELLSQEVSELNKELLDQVLAGDLDKEKLADLVVKTKELKDAQEKLKKEIEGVTFAFEDAPGIIPITEEEVNREIAAQRELNQRKLESILENEDLTLQAKEDALIAAMNAELDTLDLTASERILIEEKTQEAISELRKKAADEEKLSKEQLRDLAIETGQQIAASIFDISAGSRERQLEEARFQANEELAILEQKLESGQISEEEFGKEKEKLDEDLAKKEAELRIKQAKFDKLQAALNILLAGAPGIVKFTAGLPATAPLLIALIATIAAQEIAVLSKPIPKFHKGEIDIGSAADEFPATLKRHESVMTVEETARHKDQLTAMRKKTWDKYVLDNYYLPALQQARDEQNRSFADNIANSIIIQQGGMTDTNLLHSLKMLRRAGSKDADRVIKAITSNYGRDLRSI